MRPTLPINIHIDVFANGEKEYVEILFFHNDKCKTNLKFLAYSNLLFLAAQFDTNHATFLVLLAA